MSSKFIHYLSPHTTHENIKRKCMRCFFFLFLCVSFIIVITVRWWEKISKSRVLNSGVLLLIFNNYSPSSTLRAYTTHKTEQRILSDTHKNNKCVPRVEEQRVCWNSTSLLLLPIGFFLILIWMEKVPTCFALRRFRERHPSCKREVTLLFATLLLARKKTNRLWKG